VSATLLNSTIKAGCAAVPGASALVSRQVAALTKRVMQTMLLSKVTSAGLVVLVAAVVGAALFAHSGETRRTIRTQAALGTQPAAARRGATVAGDGSKKLLEELDWALTRVDPEKSRISALARWTWNSIANDEFDSSGLQTGLHLSFRDLPVARNAEILIDGKPAKLADLKIDNSTFKERFGLQLSLRLSPDGSEIARIEARSQNSYFFLRGVNPGNRTITVGIGSTGLLAGIDELPVAQDAKILIRDGKSRAKAGRLSDLKAGMRLSLELAPTGAQITVRGIRAEQ
jgi:hypothetical protein